MVNEADISKAIADLNSQEKPNYSQIAKNYNIDRTTLMRRYKRQTVSQAKAHSIHHKLLTDTQEEVLLGHISNLSARGLPPTPQILRNLVVEIVQHDIGEAWIRRFCNRHQNHIKSVYLRGIDQSRKIADNSAHFEYFFRTVRTPNVVVLIYLVRIELG